MYSTRLYMCVLCIYVYVRFPAREGSHRDTA